MRRILLMLIIMSFAVWGTAGCKPGLLPTEDAGKPKVTLERGEVAFEKAAMPGVLKVLLQP